MSSSIGVAISYKDQTYDVSLIGNHEYAGNTTCRLENAIREAIIVPIEYARG